MKKTDLLKLSTGQIGNVLAFMILFLFMPTYFTKIIFENDPLDWILSFSIIAISFTAGAITYLFAGYLSDRTRTRWGKRRPFFLLAVPSAIAYIFLGVVFPIPITFAFIILSILATLYAILYRLEYCAYWSLYMDLTSPEERLTTSVIFNIFGTLGTVGALLIVSAIQEPVLENGFPFIIITLVVGIVFIGTMLFSFFFGPREDPIKMNETPQTESLIQTLKETVSNKNFRYYLYATFFFVLGYSLSVQVLMPFLIEQEIELLFLLPFLLPIVIFYFWLCSRLAKTRGKLEAFKLLILIGVCIVPATIFLLVGTVSFAFAAVFLIVSIILFVVIAILTFQYAILMDVSPAGREATYSGVYLFVIVLPIPISSALIGPILTFLNFEFLIWPAGTVRFALIFLITICFIAFSYLFLRKIQSKEEM